MLYSKGEEDDLSEGEGYLSLSDSDSVKCIPLRIHGDGVPVTGLGKGWGKLVDIFSVSSVLVVGPTMLRSMMMFLMFRHLVCRDEDHNTMDTVFRMFMWSFKACWEGKHPVEDWSGVKMVYEGAGEQEKKDRGEKHLNELQQNNALGCLKMLEDAKKEKKENASELLCVSSSSSK